MSWLTKLFKREPKIEEDETEYLEYSELPNYIKTVTKPKEKELERLFNELKEKINQIDTALVELKNAKIQELNPKIVNVIIGNRESYIQHTKIFLDSIQIPEEINFTKVKQFCSQFSHNLKEFTEKSTKSFQVAKNLIGDELANVAGKIKDIEDYVKEIKLFLEEENAEELIELKKQTDNLLNTIQLKKNKQLDIDAVKKKISQLDFTQEKILEEINTISNTDDYSKLNQLKEQNKELQQKIDGLNSNLTNLFHPLDKSLRKYNKLSPDPIINNYLENSLKAIKNDSNFQIINILKKVEAALIDNQLDMKEDKKEKSLEAIKEITEEFLTATLTEHITLFGEQNTIKNKLLINKTEEKLTLLNEKLKNINTKKESLQNEITNLEKKIPSNLDDISQNLSQRLKNITTKEVKIQTKDI